MLKDKDKFHFVFFFLLFQFIICVVILAFAAVNSEAGFLPPAVVDVSHGAWPGAWSAAPWGAGHWGAPYWGAHAAYGPSLTTTSHWGAWSAPYAPYGPSAAYHADPAPHGHDGCVCNS